MPDLNKFLSEFKHGFQQPNRFVVQIFVNPTMVANIIAESSLFGLQDAVLAIPQTVKWLAEGMLAPVASMPDRGFENKVDLDMYGFTEQFPVHTTYSDLELELLMPHTTNLPFVDNGVPRFFNFWQNQMQNGSAGPDSGYDFRFPVHYYSTIVLTLLDKKDNGTVSYQFDRAYPSTVGAVKLSWDAANEFTTLPVTFTYSYWNMLPHLGSAVLSSVDKLVGKIL